jgi:urease accessory protein
MRTIDKRITPPAKLAASLVARAPTLTLAYDARCKSRLAATLDTGEEVALVLPRGTVLADGDVLVADDGALVRVAAAAEAVLVVRSRDALLLTRAAYHLGNRHTPVEIGIDYLKLEADPVLETMLTRLGVSVERATLPFHPEAGAYGGGHRHGHDASFAEDYALAQQVFAQRHGVADDSEHGHTHDPSHSDHSHSHSHSHSHGHGHHHAHDHDHDHDHGHEHEHGHTHDNGDHCGDTCGHGHYH